jgi:hypothetical protein
MLEGLSRPPIANQIAERSPLGFGERPVKFKIEVKTLLAKHVGQQVLGVESRTLHAVIPEVAGGSDQSLNDRHGAVVGAVG